VKSDVEKLSKLQNGVMPLFESHLEDVKALLAEGATINAYDPEATEKARAVLSNVTYCADANQAAEGADGVVLLTEWEEFRKIDWSRLAAVVERQLIIDGRNALSCQEAASHGFHYIGIGGVSAIPQVAASLIAT
jgi:UDPglucose 6-dehydrogenase